jgi:hypothetical protein
MAVRNMYRIEINIHEKELCVKLVVYKGYTEMHDQQNKIISTLSFWLTAKITLGTPIVSTHTI